MQFSHIILRTHTYTHMHATHSRTQAGTVTHTRTHTQLFYMGPFILAFPKLRGQPPEQSLRSSGETRIARLTTKKPPYLYPAAWQLAGKDTQMVTDKIEENKAEAQWALPHKKIPITMAS